MLSFGVQTKGTMSFAKKRLHIEIERALKEKKRFNPLIYAQEVGDYCTKLYTS